ncbi:MAG: biopolymer transporter ExbD [Planctomycetota bacterium]|nr:biopolymer transporter ExbD [Planctomycetota bacterium]
MRIRLNLTEEDDELDITPMIDVIFLLVLFFMVTSTFIEEAKVYKMILPRADSPTTVAREDADSISLTVDGQLYFRQGTGKEDEIADLSVLVERLQNAEPPRPVIIRCDERCEYRQYVEIKNALRQAGVETVFEEVEVSHAAP